MNMSHRGRALSIPEKQMIVTVKQYFDKEKELFLKNTQLEVNNSALRTALATNLSQVTVWRIMAEYHSNNSFSLPAKKGSRTRVSKNDLQSPIFVPGIWTSLTSHPSISRPIDRVFRIDFVIAWGPEIPAFLAAFPRAAVPILIVGIAQAKAFVLDLATPATSKRHKRRIATNPLLTARRLHQRRLGIATEAAMLADNWLGFHAVVSHR